jgi:2,3-bisphosphoglycerate-dependent phosphoglycerate mutase
MHLYLIRHAQSANNDLYARTGAAVGRHADPPLTEIGHRQAQLLAEYLAKTPDEREEDAPPLVGNYVERHDRRGYGLTHLYCSLMTRAIQTGGHIAEATGMPLVGWPEIHERGGLHKLDESTGEEVGLPGPGRAWFAAEYPTLVLPEALGEAGWWGRPKETIAESVPRARAVWARLLERHGDTDDRVALIIHGGFLQSLMTALLTTDDSLTSPQFGSATVGFGMSNASVSRFEIGEGFVVLRYLNRVDFLPDEFITG